MKNMKKFLGALCAAVLAFSLAIPAQAASAEYTYKVRVFAGKQGLVGGSALAEKSGIANGSITFRQAAAQDSNAGYVSLAGAEYTITLPANSKYYVKGIKVSGSETMANSVTAIDKDLDYVVVYGIKGDQVQYTVRYLDEDGNQLASDDHYMGNIGDKPIVAYRYFEGYVPNAHNLTKTLSSVESENIFTFYYRRAAEGEGGMGGDTIITEEVVTGTNTTPIIVAGGGAAAEGAADEGGVVVIPGAAGGGAGGAGADAGGGANAGGEVEIGDEAVPQDLVDLDDEDVPLANGKLPGLPDEPGSFFVNMPPAVIVGAVSLAVLSVSSAWYLLFKRKKKYAGAEAGTEERKTGKSKKKER